MAEPGNMVLALLREMRGDVADVRSEIKSLVASDLATMDAKIDRTRKELGEQITGLSRAVMEYHSSNIGHGALISELEAWKKHLDLPPFHEH